MSNYKRELQIGQDIKKRKKIETVIKFVKNKKDIKKVEVALKNAQKDIKQQTDKRQKEVVLELKIVDFIYLFCLFSYLELRLRIIV